MRKAFWLIPIFAVAFVLVKGAFAQGEQPRPVTDNEVNAVAKQMYCPVCENIPLDVCPTQACAEWRELIRLKLSEGWTSDQIKIYFAQQYGDRVLAQPPARGLNWLVYLLPPIAILAGVYIIYRAFKAWRSAGAQAETNQTVATTISSPSNPANPASGDPYIARLEEELKNR